MAVTSLIFIVLAYKWYISNQKNILHILDEKIVGLLTNLHF